MIKIITNSEKGEEKQRFYEKRGEKSKVLKKFVRESIKSELKEAFPIMMQLENR